MAATVESLKAKIEKLEKTLARHQALKAKKQAQLEKAAGPNAAYWLECDIQELEERIDAAIEKIADAHRALEAAEAVKTAKAAKEEAMPAQLKEFRDGLAAKWDAYDIAERDANPRLQPNCYGWRTDEQIHEANRESATALCENLLARIERAVGRAEGFSGLHVAKGNWLEGGAINGYVSGDRGTAEVRSILAGGHNIQRLHVRVLVIEK